MLARTLECGRIVQSQRTRLTARACCSVGAMTIMEARKWYSFKEGAFQYRERERDGRRNLQRCTS